MYWILRCVGLTRHQKFACIRGYKSAMKAVIFRKHGGHENGITTEHSTIKWAEHY